MCGSQVELGVWFTGLVRCVVHRLGEVWGSQVKLVVGFTGWVRCVVHRLS